STWTAPVRTPGSVCCRPARTARSPPRRPPQRCPGWTHPTSPHGGRSTSPATDGPTWCASPTPHRTCASSSPRRPPHVSSSPRPVTATVHDDSGFISSRTRTDYDPTSSTGSAGSPGAGAAAGPFTCRTASVSRTQTEGHPGQPGHGEQTTLSTYGYDADGNLT